jgi:hypothetical protein
MGYIDELLPLSGLNLKFILHDALPFSCRKRLNAIFSFPRPQAFSLQKRILPIMYHTTPASARMPISKGMLQCRIRVLRRQSAVKIHLRG